MDGAIPLGDTHHENSSLYRHVRSSGNQTRESHPGSAKKVQARYKTTARYGGSG